MNCGEGERHLGAVAADEPEAAGLEVGQAVAVRGAEGGRDVGGSQAAGEGGGAQGQQVLHLIHGGELQHVGGCVGGGAGPGGEERGGVAEVEVAKEGGDAGGGGAAAGADDAAGGRLGHAGGEHGAEDRAGGGEDGAVCAQRPALNFEGDVSKVRVQEKALRLRGERWRRVRRGGAIVAGPVAGVRLGMQRITERKGKGT